MKSLGLAPAPVGLFSSDDEYARQATTGIFQRMRRAALSAIADPALDLVYVHWPIPHLPGVIRDAHKRASPGYLDNLELTDTTVGAVRDALEQHGLWDRTMLLISSDHGFRPEIWEGYIGLTAEDRKFVGQTQHPFVPFLLKIPRQECGIVFEKSFSLAAAADLTLAVLRGELRKTDDVVRWLAAQGSNRRSGIERPSLAGPAFVRRATRQPIAR